MARETHRSSSKHQIFHATGRVTKITFPQIPRIFPWSRIHVRPIQTGLFLLGLTLWTLLGVVLLCQENPTHPGLSLNSTAKPSSATRDEKLTAAPQSRHIPITHDLLFGHRSPPVAQMPATPLPESTDPTRASTSSPAPPLNSILLGVYFHESRSAPASDDSSVGAALILDNDTKIRRLVRVGDRVGLWTLSHVSKRQVTFTREDLESHLGFPADTPAAATHPPSLAPSPRP